MANPLITKLNSAPIISTVTFVTKVPFIHKLTTYCQITMVTKVKNTSIISIVIFVTNVTAFHNCTIEFLVSYLPVLLMFLLLIWLP